MRLKKHVRELPSMGNAQVHTSDAKWQDTFAMTSTCMAPESLSVKRTQLSRRIRFPISTGERNRTYYKIKCWCINTYQLSSVDVLKTIGIKIREKEREREREREREKCVCVCVRMHTSTH